MTNSRTSRRSLVLWGVAGGAVASLILVLQVLPYGLSRGLTPVDEIGHIDYAIAMSVGHWPHWGDTYAQQTLLIADCAGNGFGPSGSCHPHERSATDYYPSGWSYEAQQPPLGYAAHGIVARAVGLMEPLEQLSLLRIVSLFLSFTGLLAIGALAGSVAPSARVAFAAATPAALIPEVVNASQFVTNDAALLLAGAVAVTPGLIAIVRPRTRSRTIVLLAVVSGIIVPLVKPVALVTMAAMLLWGVMFIAVGRRRGEPGSWLPAWVAGVQLIVAGATTLAFVVTQQALGSVPSRQVMDSVLAGNKNDEAPWGALVDGLREATTVPFHALEPVTEFRNATVAIIIGVLLVGLLLASAVPGPHSLKVLNPLPLAIVGAVGVTLLIWTFGLYVWGGFGLALPSRFLIPLVPLLALMWLKGLDRLKQLAWAVPVASALLVLAMVWPIVPRWVGWE